MTAASFSQDIPRPALSSWMFGRYPISADFKLDANLLFDKNVQFYKLNGLVSHAAKRTRFLRHRWSGFRILKGFIRAYFKLFNRLEIKGKENIPANGALFFANHPGSLDPLLLNIAVDRAVGCFISWGNYWFTGFLERFYTFINKQRIYRSKDGSGDVNKRDVLIELMIRNIFEKNSYFAIWPEGGLSHKRLIRRGYSSVIRAYSVINAKRDRIPFVPVVITGSECYHIYNNPTLKPKTQKITIEFLKPIFFPRPWLADPKESEEGKTPREMIDYLMLELAHGYGQKRLAPNRGLENSRKKYTKL